jgi:hypothetical protein
MGPSGESSVKTTTTPASDAKLAVEYVACAKRAEFDHRGAQVLMDGEGEPWRVKTSNEVPPVCTAHASSRSVATNPRARPTPDFRRVSAPAGGSLSGMASSAGIATCPDVVKSELTVAGHWRRNDAPVPCVYVVRRRRNGGTTRCGIARRMNLSKCGTVKAA